MVAQRLTTGEGNAGLAWLTALNSGQLWATWGIRGRDARWIGFLLVTIKTLGISIHEQTLRPPCPFNSGLPLLALYAFPNQSLIPQSGIGLPANSASIHILGGRGRRPREGRREEGVCGFSPGCS